MIMPDLEKFQNEWNVKKVRNKQQIQSTIHYLIKWTDWSFKYNFYKSVSHLADILKMIVNYKQKLKHKYKKISQINIDEILNSENVSHKQASRWDHMLYSVHSILNEILKSHVFHFICSRISTDFEWIILHLIQSVIFFTFNCSWSAEL